MHQDVACLVNRDLLILVADQSFVIVEAGIATATSYDLTRLTGDAFEHPQAKHSQLLPLTDRQQLETARSVRVAR